MALDGGERGAPSVWGAVVSRKVAAAQGREGLVVESVRGPEGGGAIDGKSLRAGDASEGGEGDAKAGGEEEGWKLGDWASQVRILKEKVMPLPHLFLPVYARTSFRKVPSQGGPPRGVDAGRAAKRRD